MDERRCPDREFHISRLARERYGIDKSLFALRGGVIVANFHAARVFAQRLNARRDLARFPETAVRAGQINAMGLIDEVLHLVVERYRQEIEPALAGQRAGAPRGGARRGAARRRTAALRRGVPAARGVPRRGRPAGVSRRRDRRRAEP